MSLRIIKMYNPFKLTLPVFKTNLKATKTTKRPTKLKMTNVKVKVANLRWLMLGNALRVKSGCNLQIDAQHAIGH